MECLVCVTYPTTVLSVGSTTTVAVAVGAAEMLYTWRAMEWPVFGRQLYRPETFE